jgi:hypothetical protein
VRKSVPSMRPQPSETSSRPLGGIVGIAAVCTALLLLAAGCETETDKAGGGSLPPADPSDLGPVMSVIGGTDPDVAVDSRGHLHIVYARGESTYYVKYDYAAGAILVGETRVGGGWDPQVAVDSRNQPHVAFGGRGYEKLMYAYWTGGGFSAPVQAMEARDRPRIALDSQDRAYVSAMREALPRVRVFVYQNGSLLVGDVEMGMNDYGSLALDPQNRAHALWRTRHSMHHSSYAYGESTAGIVAAADQVAWESSSDNGWIAVDKNGNLHAVHTRVGYGEGIHYATRPAAGAWSPELLFAQDDVHDDPDLTNPTVDVDGRGYKYVAFSGEDFVPRYFVVGPESETAVAVSAIDAGSRCGGKYENPNVASRWNMIGAYVAWESGGTVHVRRLGKVSF